MSPLYRAAFYGCVAALAVAVIISAFKAKSDEFNLHPNVGGQAHWYDYECCNLRDCAAVRVTISNDQYHWTSWRHPEFAMSLPVTAKNVKSSQDGRFHACELQQWEGGEITGMYTICFYVPPSM